MVLAPLPPVSFPALNAGLRATGRRRAAPIEEITPEEEEGLLGQVMGGLEYIALTLDKPGAAVRGALSAAMGDKAGGGLLNLIPFSDTMGITDEKERVWGRDLLTTAGITPTNKPGLGEWWDGGPTAELGYDVAGFAAEVLTDPLTLIKGPGGALTKAGLDLVKKARKVPNTMAGAAGRLAAATKGKAHILGTTPIARSKEIEQELRGIASIGLPFVEKPWKVFGAGSKKAAALHKWLAYAPGWRHLRSFWAPDQLGLASREGAEAAGMKWHTMHQIGGAVADMRQPVVARSAELGERFTKFSEYANIAGDKIGKQTFDDFARHVAEEGTATGGNMKITADQVRKMLVDVPDDLSGAAEKFSGDLFKYVEDLQGSKDLLKTACDKMGIGGGWLDDTFGGHAFRSPDRIMRDAIDSVQARREFNMGVPSAIQREEAWSNVPGMTASINKAAMNDLLGATKHAHATGKLAIPQAAKDAGLEFGQWVSAKDSRGWGRIRGFDGDAASVNFVHPDGTQSVGAFGVDALKPVKNLDEIPFSVQEAMPAPGRSKPEIKAALKAWTEKHTTGDITKLTADDISAEYLKREILLPAAQNHARITGEALSADWAINIDKQARTLVKRLAELPESARAKGLFNRSYIEDTFDYMEHMAGALSNAHAGHNLFAQTARALTKAPLGPEELTLDEAWRSVVTKAGKDGRPALNQAGLETLTERIANADVKSAAPSAARLTASTIAVPKRAVGAMNAMVQVMEPKNQGWFIQMWDDFTAMFKGGVTTAFPPFHVRNYVDGMWRNFASAGDKSFSIPELMSAHRHVSRAFKGKVSLEFGEDIKRGLLETHQLYDITGVVSRHGVPEKGFLGSIAESYRAGEMSWRPWEMRGTSWQRPGKQFGLFAAGDSAYKAVEGRLRAAPYVALRRKGWSHSQAKHWVDTVQYDYSKLSPFGKSVGRRIIPFWGFVSKNLPYQFSELMSRPGGRHAQTLRFINAMQRENAAYTPSWMKEGFSARVAGTDEAATSIYKLGLSIEDLRVLSVTKGGGLSGRTISKMIAQLSPGITTPAKLAHYSIDPEGAFDPYTGKKLKHMYGVTGNPMVDAALQGSPAGRFISYGQQVSAVATGRRPPFWGALGLGTGVGVGTHDLEKWRIIDMQRAAKLRAARERDVRVLERPYIPKSKAATAAPSAKRSVELIRLLSEQSAALRAERDVAEKAAGGT